MKKALCLAAAIMLLLGCAACGTGAKDTLEGTPQELLAQLKETAAADFGMAFDSEVTAETAPGTLGLTADEFEKFVDSASESAAAISSIAQSNVLVKCKDAAAAAEVKKLIAEGYDSGKWICVFPEQSVVVESGSYVLLAVGTTENTNALIEALKTVSDDNTGSPDVFYAHDTSAGDIIGGDDAPILF